MSDAPSAVSHLPALDPATGCLPPGRFLATFDSLRARFVDAEEYQGSHTRKRIWGGFLSYVGAWSGAEEALGARIVVAWWIGGSFLTSVEEVGDIDVTPILDRDVWEQYRGTEGMGRARALIKHRASVRDAFGVEPFPLLWSDVPCTLFPDHLEPPVQEMLRDRGGLDAWWQRRRPPGEKHGPGLPTRFAERGYVEVQR